MRALRSMFSPIESDQRGYHAEAVEDDTHQRYNEKESCMIAHSSDSTAPIEGPTRRVPTEDDKQAK